MVSRATFFGNGGFAVLSGGDGETTGLIAVESITYTAPSYSLTVNGELVVTSGIGATSDNAPNLAANFALYLGGASTVKNLTGVGAIFADNSPTTLNVVGPASSFAIESDLGGGLLWDSSQLGSTGILTVVPEPGTSALVVLGLLVVQRFRRRARQR